MKVIRNAMKYMCCIWRTNQHTISTTAKHYHTSTRTKL